MSNTSSNNSGGGIGLSGVLLAIFVTLKLCGVINWSWWWVLSPIWIGFAFVAVVFAVALIIAALSGK